MRPLLLVPFVLGVGAPSCVPSSPSGSTPRSTPALSKPAPATVTSKAPASAAASPPCPQQTHSADPPTWKGSPLLAAIYAKDVKQVRLLAVGSALHELDSFEATPLIAAVSPNVPEPTD